MKCKLISPPGLILKTGVMAIFALTLAWLPQANASVTAGAVIENVATVSWEDSAANPYSADDYTQVTVNLVEAAVTLTGRPTGATPGDTAALPAAQTVLTGATATYLYAITATANGSDVYNFNNGTGIDAVANVDGTETVTWALMAADGTTVVTGGSPNTVTLASAIVENVPSDTQLVFPGGAVADFAVGDVVVINGYDYAITNISANNAPNHGTTTAETQATITFGANGSGFNTAPLFLTGGAGLTVSAGDVVGEQQLLQISVTAAVNPATATGTVDHDVVIDTAPATNVTQRQNVTTTFEPLPTVSIVKEVRNITTNSAFAATGTGDPGDILEYRLTISNSGSTAEAVVVTDPVPGYTTLETFLSGTGYPSPLAGPPSTTLGDGSGAATDIFAHVSDSAGAPVTVDLTVQNSDDEGTTVASGDTTGTAAGSTLSIYVGRDQTPTNTGPTVGGDIADSATVTDDVFLIYYRVRINP